MTDTPSNDTQRFLNYTSLWSNIEREATRKLIRYISRRDFMKLMSAGAAGVALVRFGSPRAAAQTGEPAPFEITSETRATLPNGIASGDTTQTSTVLWTRSTQTGTVTFDVAADEAFGEIIQSLTAEATDAAIPVKVQVRDLTPATIYHYRATDAAGTILTGRFRTSAENGANGLRFGVSGDWRGELRPFVALSNAPTRDLEFFVEHGDTIYADIPSLDFAGEQALTVDEYRVKHNEVYSERYGLNTWADLRAVTSILTTIDDHEVTNDFAGGAAPETDERFAAYEGETISATELYTNGMQVYGEYNPTRDEMYEGTGDPRVDGRPKLYRYNTYGSDASVIVLDARSFRDQSVPEIDTGDIFDAEVRGAFLASMFQEGRTMLGRPQVEDLKRDLLDAETRGITWKFVMIPEPAQQTGWFGGNDRWEGYAPERTEVMQFINDNNIRNVVFVAADVHTTFINRLFYQTEAGGELTQVNGAFEISTGSVAFYPPTGQALVEGAAEFGLVPAAQFEAYQAGTIAEKDEVLLSLFNRFVTGLDGFGDLSLEGLDAAFETGTFVAGHTFGWTEFDIAPETQTLTVTTYGVPAYDAQTALDTPEAVTSLVPDVISRFTVNPQTA
jgi:phosphodiesterase/alkaline phosphatase D-like protein